MARQLQPPEIVRGEVGSGIFGSKETADSKEVKNRGDLKRYSIYIHGYESICYARCAPRGGLLPPEVALRG